MTFFGRRNKDLLKFFECRSVFAALSALIFWDSAVVILVKMAL